MPLKIPLENKFSAIKKKEEFYNENKNYKNITSK